MKTFRNSQDAFEDAIKHGALQREQRSDTYAGNYMYMYTEGGADFFKNIFTRKYITVKGNDNA